MMNFEKAEQACEKLMKLTEKWTLDFAPQAFVFFFSEHKVLLDLIVKEILIVDKPKLREEFDDDT
jgi:hypothetical protein